MIDYRELMTQARRKGRYNLIDYLRYRMQNRYAYYVELKHIYSMDKLSILKDVYKDNRKKVCFNDFLGLNGKTIVVN